MKTLVKIAFLVVPLAFCSKVQAQNANPEKNKEAIIESLIENIDEDTDVSLIIEDLEEIFENPININATNQAELSRLHILNDIQIQKLVNYLKEYGPAFSIYELNTIDGFSPPILSVMEPFIYFGPVESKTQKLSETLKFGRHQVLARVLGTMQKPKGYKPNKDGNLPYEGNRFRYYNRYRYQSSDRISAGLTAEKDPGEAFLSGSNPNGFDYYSGHLSFKINSNIEQVIIGDFIVRSGQGLVFWQGFSMGKSLNTIALAKTNQGIRPYTSVDENLFFRGTAASLRFGNAKVSLFYSQKRADGNLENDESSIFFTSLQTSGYHRTQSEIDDEKSVKQSDLGAIASWSFNHFKIGTSLSLQKFEMPFIKNEQIYNRFRFSGIENRTAGVDYLYNKGNYQLFGEAAISKSKGKAVLQGANVHLHDQLGFSIVFRHFDKKYHALWANAFAEGTGVNNESGLYFGTKFLPVKFVQLSAYSDFYKSEWFNFTTAGPSKGWDIFTQADFVFSSRFEFYLRFKNERKEQKFIVEERYANLPEKIQRTRLHFHFKPSEQLSFKTRFEHANYKGIKKENGFMVFQDVQLNPNSLPLNLSARLAWFKTGGYDSRIYAYENDLLYTFSIPAFFGNGFRTFLNLKYKMNDKLDFWIKLANTTWTDRETISSGYNEILGSNKTELKLQLRLKF